MTIPEKFDTLETEGINPNTDNIDTLSSIEIARLMNEEDKKIPFAVEKELKHIARLSDTIYRYIKDGGRCIYVGAGTSGRLAVMDAAEVIPTFNLPSGIFIAILAGGDEAMKKPIEKIEDDSEEGKKGIEKLRVSKKDVVIGVSASGRTPFVIGALLKAKELGAFTGAITNTSGSKMGKLVDISIEVITGPEVIMGSTRLKAGTAQKMVLNMLSTISMIRLGKVYKNLMVDVTPINEKLINRAERIVSLATGISKENARKLLKEANTDTKVAIVMALTGKEYKESKRLLNLCNGKIREVLKYTKMV